MSELAENIRVIIQQPALPKYRLPFLRRLASNSGIDLHVVYGDAPNSPTSATPKGFKATFEHIRRWRSLLWHHVAFASARRSKCDVLIMAWDLHYLSLVPALLRARLNGVKTAVWGHGYSKNERRIRAWARRCVGKLADATIFYNHTAANMHIQRFGWNPKRVFVALNAIDQSACEAAKAEWLETPKKLSDFREANHIAGHDVVVFCSRLSADNRVDLLLEAVARLVPKHPKLTAVIIGGGDEATNLKNIATRLGISDRVNFTGAIYEETKLAPWFMSAKIFCYPANIGLSLLHAFGYGLPAVTCDAISAQNPEIEALLHEHNGLLYADGNIEALATALDRLLRDDAFRQKLSANALNTVQQKFTLDRMVQGLEMAICYCAGVRITPEDG
jgi:glycosyltransferase involved in cell wall biosynthesis